MKKPKLVKSKRDKAIAELVDKTDRKVLAVWAADCALRVLPHFENAYPDDDRPRNAIQAGRSWVRGELKVGAVRKVASAAHTAAREAYQVEQACAAARSAGHAAATAHMGRHSIAAAIYAASAVRDADDLADSDAAVGREREWQHNRLLVLRKD